MFIKQLENRITNYEYITTSATTKVTNQNILMMKFAICPHTPLPPKSVYSVPLSYNH